jgi:hypothetical protein
MLLHLPFLPLSLDICIYISTHAHNILVIQCYYRQALYRLFNGFGLAHSCTVLNFSSI